MFCRNCGNQINDGAAFCPKCGAKIVIPAEMLDEVSVSTSSDTSMSTSKGYISQQNANPSTKHNKKSSIVVSIVIVLLIAVVAGGILFYRYQREEALRGASSIRESEVEEALKGTDWVAEFTSPNGLRVKNYIVFADTGYEAGVSSFILTFHDNRVSGYQNIDDEASVIDRISIYAHEDNQNGSFLSKYTPYKGHINVIIRYQNDESEYVDFYYNYDNTTGELNLESDYLSDKLDSGIHLVFRKTDSVEFENDLNNFAFDTQYYDYGFLVQ